MTTTIPVNIQGLYAAQRPIVEHPAKVKVLRCGRRFGKTQLAVHEAVMCLASKGKVGWFAPETQYADEAWSRLKRALGDAVVAINAQKRTMEIRGGGQLYMYSMEANEDPGRGQDFDLAIIDEAGLCPNIDEIYDRAIEPTLLDRNGTLYVLGTSKQNGIGFRRLYQRAATEHGWAAFRAKTLDNPYLDNEAVARVAAARDRAVRAGTLAQWEAEYEGGDHDDAASFFPVAMLEAMIAECRDPLFRCNIDVPMQYAFDRDHWIASGKRDLAKVQVRTDAGGAWRFWLPLVADRNGRMRPPQARAYAMGIDPGNGVGANPAIISVGDETGRKVAVYRNTRVTPPELARVAAIAGIWFGGRLGQAAMLYEANGPGESFGQNAVQMGYAGLLKRTEFGSRTHPAEKDAYGWWSTPTAKEQLFIAYREALTSRQFFNPSADGLRECLGYRYDEHGRVVSDLTAERTHGDEAIADALLHAAMGALPPATMVTVPPVGSEAFEEFVEARQSRHAGSGW